MYSYGGIKYNFPKEFGNYEQLNMYGCQGPFYEFPVRRGSLYGNDDNTCEPEEERVIVNDCGDVCAVITHKGAPGNGFVSCLVHTT